MFEKIFTQQEMLDLQNKLLSHSKTLTCAESCTGGLVSSYITSNSGSSEIFNGSIISYSNLIKNQELGVKIETLEKYGAVSKEVVKQMLSGALKKFDANYAIAISGVAGPTGGSEEKPVGTVVIGVADDSGLFDIEIYHFKGGRNEVQIQAAKRSLKKFSNFFPKTLDKL